MKHIIETVNNILSALFPHVEPIPYLSPFISESDTWLNKIMQDTQIVDYLWTPSKDSVD